MKKKKIFLSVMLLISAITGFIQNPAGAFNSTLGLSQADKVNLSNTNKNIDKLIYGSKKEIKSTQLADYRNCGCGNNCYGSCSGSCGGNCSGYCSGTCESLGGQASRYL